MLAWWSGRESQRSINWLSASELHRRPTWIESPRMFGGSAIPGTSWSAAVPVG